MKRRFTLFPAVLCLAACTGQDAGAGIKQATPPTRFLDWEVVAAESERSKLAEAVATVDDILSSSKFWDDFATVAADYSEIQVGNAYSGGGPRAGFADPASALAFLKNADKKHSIFPARVTLTGTYIYPILEYFGTCSAVENGQQKTIGCQGTEYRQNYSNRFVVTHGIGSYGSDGREHVSIELGRPMFARYDKSDVKKKSCVMNSLAHEWVHTIGKPQNGHWSIAVDNEVRPGVTQLTYLAGSVAQCSWLQSNKHIGAGTAALKACVADFGVDQFRSNQCD
jgi:hypothetical protein